MIFLYSGAQYVTDSTASQSVYATINAWGLCGFMKASVVIEPSDWIQLWTRHRRRSGFASGSHPEL